MRDYERSKECGLIVPDRWEKGTPHHPMSRRLMSFLEEHDLKDYDNCFDWETGGDGDNGETLMYQMDAFFELLDKEMSHTEDHVDHLGFDGKLSYLSHEEKEKVAEMAKLARRQRGARQHGKH